uniref:Pre-mRNA-splicing factor CEF1 n=1 Tax=Blastobotrys adeninivorans TaxID=409370 RepID=A0A060T4Z3_BLAAD
MSTGYIRGGTWTNVEDEILKAAVSKYGLNQWARVSSLLARKTPKQVKARWTEWLDPSIKKMEWSREEDEKLLHLAKLMPSQWRSIAPIVGRTANQCIERYQKLLDDAERLESGRAGEGDLALRGVDEAGDAIGGPSSSYADKMSDIHGVDAIPETRPALPDAIDMDEDEKEMLSEARARLANTQGKKAKRKDRERMLQESSRLALIQKRRELKQAGINMKLKRKKPIGGVDYNTDIPFEHKPAQGIYDTSEEKGANLQEKLKYQSQINTRNLPSSKDGNKKKGKDQDKSQEQKDAAAEQAAAARALKLQQIEESEQIAKRRKLELPEPQVRDDELEHIVKMDRRGKAPSSDMHSGATDGLLTEYKQTMPQAAPTPQVTSQNIARVTSDIRALNKTQSSLLGEEDTPLQESFSGTIMPPPQPPSSAARPVPSAPAFQTPRRDGLGVYSEQVGATPRSAIRQGFMSLPKPKNDFKISLEDQEEMEVDHDHRPAAPVVPDRGELEKKKKELERLEKERQLARRSQVIKLSLPRPDVFDFELQFSGYENDGSKQVRQEIEAELKRLVISDAVKYPIGGANINKPTVDDLDDNLKAAVCKEIEAEMNQLEGQGSPHPLLPTDTGTLDEVSGDSISDELTRLAEQANKVEKKLGLVFGGYMKRREVLNSKLGQVQTALEEKQKNIDVFSQLRDMESIALSSRLSTLQEEVNFLVDTERAGQERYRDLMAQANVHA